jgi:hypothetical protein
VTTFASGVRTRRYDTTTGWSPGCKCDNVASNRMPDERQELRGRDSPQGVDRLVGAAGGAAAPAQPIPCTVLDPFLGSGTTALVADRLQRHAIGIDLSLTYAEMAQRRIEMDCPLFTSWAPAEDPEEARMADLFVGVT